MSNKPTAIGTARVNSTLDGADTEPIPARAQADTAATGACPAWCCYRTLPVDICGADHLSESVDVPATAGGHIITGSAAAFPYVGVTARTAGGVPTVNLTVFSPLPGDDPDWLDVDLHPVAARVLAEDLSTLVTGQRDDTRAPGVDGAAWAAVAAGKVGVVVVDRRKGRQLSATLRLDELDRVAAALVAAVSMVTR
jgi:hypothetical protein